jgi:hypothetical protein
VWCLSGWVVFFSSSGEARAGWQALGTRWAVERGDRGVALRIDDLTYPGLFGRVMVAHVNPASFSGDNKAVPEWWRTVPWKDGVIDKSDQEPARFSFDDIDFTRATNDPALFEEITATWGPKVLPGFLKSFSFERDPEGGYRLYWESKAGDLLPRALRVVTLSSPKANLWRTLRYQITQNVLGLAAGLITVPVVSALLDTALDRFFHWSDLLVSTRQEALAEMLSDPQGDFGLSAYERQRAAIGILYGETRLLMAPAWLWRRPATVWATRKAGERGAAKASRVWLGRSGLKVEPLSEVFDWDPSNRTYYLSGARFVPVYSPRGPIKGLDPARPNAILARRLRVEVGVTAAVFAGNWIPWLGSLAATGLKALIEYPEDALRAWEARLAVRLEDREARWRENWGVDLERLHRQQGNPLEVPRVTAVSLIARRKAKLGLPVLPGPPIR